MKKRNGCYEPFIKKMDYLFERGIKKRTFSGAAMGICIGAPEKRDKIIKSYGKTKYGKKARKIEESVFFDLASLTKPLATTLAILALIKEKKIRLTDNLPTLLEEELPQEKKKIDLRQLLKHAAGFPAYKPYFEKLIEYPKKERKNFLKGLVYREPLVYKPGEKTIYSDLGFMVLGWIVEKKAGKSLDKYVEEKIIKPLGLSKDMFFRPISGAGKGKIFAATEDCPWRKKTLSGEVSDDNSYVVGGVSGQAGLFGNIKGVLEITTHLLDQWQGREKHPAYNPDDLKRFLTRQDYHKESTWALGFDTPAEKGSSSGKYLSKESVGHLGFTGTSFWIDPTRELVVVLLTNRVHPSRENNKIKEFRPLFHDTVIEELKLI